MVSRLFFFLLVFANLVLFAWTQGYLGVTAETREPQRLAQQLNADKLHIVHDAASREEKLACRAVSGLTSSVAEALERAVNTAGGKTRRLQQQAVHRLVIPALASQTATDKKMAELRRLGLGGANALALPDGRYEIVLGSFSDETAAREFLATLTKRGVKSVQWEKPAPATLLVVVEIQAPAGVLASRLPEWIAPYATTTVSDCVR